MRKFLTASIVALSFVAFGQNTLPKTALEDKELSFYMLDEDVCTKGSLWFCIGRNGDCIANLTVAYTVRVYDANDEEIWNSIWTGKTTDIRFAKPLPLAKKVVIEAVAPFVVNTLSTNRIGTGTPLKLTYEVQASSKP